MSDLTQRVYSLLRQVPKGKVTTYKELGRAAGTKSYRAIGQILRRNPDAPNTPCHRVVASNGTTGGFMGETQGAKIMQKKRLLKSEGIKFNDNRIINFDNVFHKFN